MPNLSPSASKAALWLALLGVGAALALLPLKVAAAAVAGGAMGILLLLRPAWGLYLLIPAIPFGSVAQVSLGGASIGAVEALLALMLASWLAQMTARREVVIPHPPLLWPFLLFLATVGLSWWNTFSLAGSLVETLKWLEMLALYLFLAARFRPPETGRLVTVILLAGLAQAGVGLYQFLFKAGPEGFLLFGGRFLRAFGTFRQPNPYAGYLGLVLPLALSVTLWSADRFRARRDAPSLAWLALGGASLGGMLAALFASQSRGGWIGFAGAAVITVLLMGGRWTAAAVAGLSGTALAVSMGALAILPPAVTQRFADVLPYAGVTDVSTIPVTDANFAAIERLAHWQAARAMWLDHFWLGVGFGNYAAVYPAYAVGRWLDPLGHAHNYLLNIGAEAGLVGLLGYLLFWGWVILFSLHALRRTEPRSLQRAVVAGGLGIFTHLHLHNLFDNLYVQGMYLHVAVIFGLITLVAGRGGRIGGLGDSEIGRFGDSEIGRFGD